MELMSRPMGDRYTRPGEYREIERRLRADRSAAHMPCLVYYAFDRRTRVGPFLFADMQLLPAGPRAVAGALDAAGFEQTRVVLRQWNPNLRPFDARMDGAIPKMLFVSSMQIHSADARDLIADAHRLGDERPLILAGGAKAIYEPSDFFGFDADGRRCSADVACTGEEFVILQLLDRIMAHRGRDEHPRRAFHRLRRMGALHDIPGLVFREGDERDQDGRLIDTGVQRLVQDLDELPHPIRALGMIEPPHRRRTLNPRPLAMDHLPRHVGAVSLVTTHGCKFHCSYCPIPAYNQFTFRYKSPQRLRDEMQVITERTGVYGYFGTDDNFFNDRGTVEATFSELARGTVHGRPFRDAVIFGTEATEFDVHKNRDLLPLCRAGGLRAIWFGIEDMTAELVKKGQSPEKTSELFRVLNGHGICPMAMMMHHDGQPLASRGSLYGLLNQVNYLRRAGAVSVQVTILTPSVGSKGYEKLYQDGMVIDRAGPEPIEDRHYDGNHCIATADASPWRKQANMWLAYASFYNPVNIVRFFVAFRHPLWTVRVWYQVLGMLGLVKSLARDWRWMFNLYRGPVSKMAEPPKRRQTLVPASSLRSDPRDRQLPSPGDSLSEPGENGQCSNVRLAVQESPDVRMETVESVR